MAVGLAGSLIVFLRLYEQMSHPQSGLVTQDNFKQICCPSDSKHRRLHEYRGKVKTLYDHRHGDAVLAGRVKVSVI